MKQTLRLVLLALFCAFTTQNIKAQALDIQIGSGTTTMNSMPINYLYNYAYTQQIVTAAEITAAGGQQGLITKIRYYWATGTSSTSWQNWTMYMGNTTQAAFPGTAISNWVPITQLTQVFSGNITTTTSGNWFEITLDTPFLYSGQNLVIAVDENSPSYTSTTFRSYTPQTGVNRGIHYRNDSTNPDPANPLVASGVTAAVPQVQLVINPLSLQLPTAITQSAASCATGVSLTATGSPEPNSEWYWQTTATGTSTVFNANTPYTALTNNTYYVRYYYPSANYWGPSQAVLVTSIPTEATPVSPVAFQNPACTNTNGTALHMPAGIAPIENYWQGQNSTSISMANPTTADFQATETGTYYVRAYNTATQCWSDASNVFVTVDDEVPPTPTSAQAFYTGCVGSTEIELTANSTYLEANTLTTNFAAGSSCSNGNMFNLITGTGDVIINGFDLNPNTSGATVLKVYIKENTYQGFEQNQSAWTLMGQYNYNAVNGVATFVPVTPFTLSANTTYGVYLDYNAKYGITTASETYTAPGLTLVTGAGFCTAFGSPNANRRVNATIHYEIQVAGNTTWFDAALYGNMIGNTNVINAIGTSILPAATQNGTYDFYAAATLGGCLSTNRLLVQVAIADVHVELTTIGVQCHNGQNGSVYVTNTECGTPPFQYSVDGGAFDPQAMGLLYGAHTVQVRDANMLLSPIYPIEIQNAPVPTDIEFDYIYDTDASITWTATGMEQQWIVEWGPEGFTPGLGLGTGIDTVDATTAILTGMLGNTDYDVYVSATCASSVPGDWTSASFTTDCSAMPAMGYCESFEDASNLDCWKVLNLNNDTDQWIRQTSATYSNTGTASMQLYTDYNAGNNNDYLIMPRMILTGNEVLTFSYRARSTSEPNNMKVMISTTGMNPGDFTEVLNLPSFNNTTYTDTTIDISAYTGSAYIAFVVLPDGLDGYYIYLDDVCIDLCHPVAGTDGAVAVCRSENTVDLQGTITSPYTHGTWQNSTFQSFIDGSIMNVQYLTAGVYEFDYVVTAACSSDTTHSTLTITDPLSAGENGMLTACKNQMINLFGGLTGNVDHEGTWYNTSGTAISSPYLNTGTMLGQFVYKYVVSDTVCGSDTSEVIVNILNCNYLDVEEFELLDAMTIVPNPSTGKFQIVGAMGTDFTFQVIDMKGSVVRANQPLNHTTSFVDLSDVETGVYMIHIVGTESNKMLRVVKQ